jgi:hypothetical protein
MEIFVNIDGVLRNTLQKFDYHYKDYFLNTEPDKQEIFEYGINGVATIENILDTYKFQSEDEYLKFLYFDFPIEIFGHAGLSYNHASTDFNTMVFENKDTNFTLVGLNEKGKAKPSTLFFLSRNGVICDNIKFSTIENIDELWGKCDLWITDDKRIVDKCPENKKVIKFNTFYNNHFTNKIEISKLSEIEKKWLNYSENDTTSI